MSLFTVAFAVQARQVSTNAAYRSGRGKFYMTPEGKAFKDALAVYAKLAMKGRRACEYPVYVAIDFWFATRKNDIDGPIKLVLDSLQPFVIKNDRQVIALQVHKHVATGVPFTRVSVVEVRSESAQ